MTPVNDHLLGSRPLIGREWLVDTHAHLDMFKPKELPSLLDRAAAAGVGRVVTVATDLPSSRKAVEIAAAFPGVFATAGVHPHDARDVDRASLQELKELAAANPIVAVGETGLDYYRMLSPKEAQLESLERHIELAAQLDLPLILHCRDAYDDLGTILARTRPAKTVLHCFSGNPAQALVFLGLGCYISFAGTVTFEKAENLQEAARVVPLERLLVETDAPYLAPRPHRGRRNEPAYVRHTAEKIAELKAVPFEEVLKAVRQNADEVFHLSDGELG